MLTVWCLCWGDKYPDYYVQRLQREVAANLTIEHQFVCVTDRHIPDVWCVPPVVDWPGWWGKIALFKNSVSSDHNLFLDLDVVITGSLDNLVKAHCSSVAYDTQCLAMPNNWAQSGHGGCQSSVMLWDKNYNSQQIYDLFDPITARWPPVNKPGILWGDQEWITQLRDTHKIQVNPIKSGIYSYKYHCRNGLPEDCKVVVFHGEPKPAEVKVDWFKW